MAQRAEHLKAELIDKVIKLARDRLGERAAEAERFFMGFFQNVQPADMIRAGAESLYASAVSLWSFARERPPGQARIRVFNPAVEEHGWMTDHTVVEIVNDDMPFLVDSVTSELSRRDIGLHVLIHPVMKVRRDSRHHLQDVLDLEAESPVAEGETPPVLESYMHLQIDHQADEAARAGLADRLGEVLEDVRVAVQDWRFMRDRALDLVGELEPPPRNVPPAEVAEARDFLNWVHDDHFTFLGIREFVFEGEQDAPSVACLDDLSLGVLRRADMRVFDETRNLAAMPTEVLAFLRRPSVLLITKSASSSVVHRPVPMDVIGVKRFDAQGKVTGLVVLLGLFTSVAYTRNPAQIPVLRRKVQRTIARAGFRPSSHDGKALLNILDTFPRDELFQIDDAQLFEIALSILHLQERPRVALFVRRDEFERFVSAIVFVPRDRYDTPLRLAVHRALEQAYHGHVATYFTQVADSPLARLHFIVATQPGALPEIDLNELENRIAEAARSWSDHLLDALLHVHGEDRGLRLVRRWGEAFPVSYRESHTVHAAIADIDRMEEMLATDSAIALNLYRPIEAAESEVRFKLYHGRHIVPLSDVLPMLENMGFRVLGEVPHHLKPGDGIEPLWMHDFGMESADGEPVPVGALKDRFHDAFRKAWAGSAESDDLNRLVLRAGLDWREVMVVRAFTKYLRQTGFPFSQAYIGDALATHAHITSMLLQLFRARLDPASVGKEADSSAAEAILDDISKALEDVANADEDRILRRFVNLVESTLRTNFFQHGADGGPKPYLSLKLDSRQVEDLPLPRPMVEIYVYSPRVEGVHLRGGMVARGGLRWSDRKEDFRTEVLGLMKAQMVKNAVIVPVGSKGGFVVKRPPPEGGREALMAEGIECYKIFIRGLLDLTDNLQGGDVVPPCDVVRRDGDDAYLVVAADKGTASFSDIANGVSAEYGFWLGDAFASGGSQGYDHKVMGITARGAWVSVQRHFREMGIDTQTQDFTAIGIGDMSGDVFGNGMLRSRHTRLLAAFNHLHIFIDPDPDPDSSFDERQRLFDKPRSSWSDYDPSLISAGGGVFRRDAKRLPLSPEIKALFGITADHLTPNELIRVLLQAEVDLMFFGGIGTYVKSSRETQADAGDRANDSVRVDGREVRAKVVGEGANLAFTQRGRIEYALAGGRINTDAIDNAAGVDTSDHEVNIKILLNEAVAAGDLTVKQRNEVLAAMTDEVAHLVLRDNYLQTQAITVIETQAAEMLDLHDRLMRLLEKSGRLNRDVEYLPGEEAISERAAAHKGLTRPELAVLLSYAKIWLYDYTLDCDLPDDPSLAEDLRRYFPQLLQDRFGREIEQHRLRREIIATNVVNSMVNRVGIGFVAQAMERAGANPTDVARAYIVTRDAFGLRDLWGEIETLDNKVPAECQAAMLVEINRLVERGTLWLLRYGARPLGIADTVAELGPGICEFIERVDDILPAEARSWVETRAEDFTANGVPEALARRVASQIVLASAPDVVRLKSKTGWDIADIGKLYFLVGKRFGLGWLRSSAERLAGGTHWTKLAVAALIEELYGLQRDLAQMVAESRNGENLCEDIVTTWAASHPEAVERVDQLIGDLRTAGALDLAMLTVALRRLKTLCDA